MFHVEQSITYKNVPRGTFDQTKKLIGDYEPILETYLDKLLWWNKRVNLVSRSAPKEEIRQHIYHSLLLAQFDEFKDTSTIVDAGSGGGLPGIPLSIIAPEKKFIINDIVSKKMLAIQQIARNIGLENIEINKSSIANIEIDSPFLLVSKHAFKINELLDLVKDKSWSDIILFKGLPFTNELNNLPIDINIVAYRLDSHSNESFFKNKCIIKINRL